MTRPQIERLIDAVEEASTNRESLCHGPQHWRCVSLVGVRLSGTTPGADALVAFLFGLFHDAMRENDWQDEGHGTRGASLMTRFYRAGLIPITLPQYEAALLACQTHTEAAPTKRAVLGVCYDADRLNLWRVCVRPEPAYLSTIAGREMARTNATEHLHNTTLTWSAVLNDLFPATPAPPPKPNRAFSLKNRFSARR